MKIKSNEPARSEWRPVSVYTMAVVCLLLGALAGYLLRGSAAPASPGSAASAEVTDTSGPAAPQMPSLDDMKRMAEKQAEPVLAKLQVDPKNAELLIQVGAIYQATHRFKEAAEYYRKALEIKPDNVAIRTHEASCLYYAGDVEGALAELQRSLKDDPHNANALFNLGMMKWQGKQDAKGALSAWQALLDRNPKLEATKKADVQKLMAELRQHPKADFATTKQVSKE